MPEWPRNDKIAAIGVVITILLGVAAIYQKEIRIGLGADPKSSPTPGTSTTSIPSPSPPANSKPDRQQIVDGTASPTPTPIIVNMDDRITPPNELAVIYPNGQYGYTWIDQDQLTPSPVITFPTPEPAHLHGPLGCYTTAKVGNRLLYLYSNKQRWEYADSDILSATSPGADRCKIDEKALSEWQQKNK